VDLDAFGRQVLAELGVREGPAFLRLPPPRVLDGVGVDRLVGTAVGLSIRLVVAREVHAAGRDAALDRRLPDRAARRPAVVLEIARPADADGEDAGFAHALRPCSGSARFRSPVASKMPLATAGARATMGHSPAPAEGRSVRLTSTISIGGTSVKRGRRY